MKTIMITIGRLLLELVLGWVAVVLVDYGIGFVALHVLHHTPTQVGAMLDHLGGTWPVLVFIALCELLLMVRRRRRNLARTAVETS